MSPAALSTPQPLSAPQPLRSPFQPPLSPSDLWNSSGSPSRSPQGCPSTAALHAGSCSPHLRPQGRGSRDYSSRHALRDAETGAREDQPGARRAGQRAGQRAGGAGPKRLGRDGGGARSGTRGFQGLHRGEQSQHPAPSASGSCQCPVSVLSPTTSCQSQLPVCQCQLLLSQCQLPASPAPSASSRCLE